jgi:hypothetical protein
MELPSPHGRRELNSQAQSTGPTYLTSLFLSNCTCDGDGDFSVGDKCHCDERITLWNDVSSKLQTSSFSRISAGEQKMGEENMSKSVQLESITLRSHDQKCYILKIRIN